LAMGAPLRCAYGARPVAARIHTRAGSRSAERRRLSRYSRARESVSAQRLLARLRIGSGAARHGGAVEWAEDASDVHNYPFRCLARLLSTAKRRAGRLESCSACVR